MHVPATVVAHRSRALLLTTALLLGVFTARPGAAGPASVHVLAGRTTITSTASSSTARVWLGRGVTLTENCFPDTVTKITGSAQVVVLALTPLRDPGSPVIFGRFPRQEGGHTFSSPCNGARLEAGFYSLHLLHTPGTAAVTLQLPGLAGRSSFVATASGGAGAKVSVLPAVAPYRTLGAAGSFAATGSLAGRGAVYAFGWMHTGLSAAATMGDCEVDGPLAALPPALVQSPGCPFGGSGSDTPGPRGNGESFHAGGLGNAQPGAYSIGLYYLSEAVPHDAGAIGAWIPNAP